MQRILSLFLLLVLLSCDNDRGERNPFLQDLGFRADLNLNLPLFNPLLNIGNPVYVDIIGVGTRGVFVVQSSIDQYRVFEASCPNHAPNDCSTMDLNGQIAICSCEGYEYSLFTGQFLDRPEEGLFFDMLEYRGVRNGNIITISN